ncbi:MAG: hypothetical protein PVI07_14315, partial [Anaerolineae bacterium]
DPICTSLMWPFSSLVRVPRQPTHLRPFRSTHLTERTLPAYRLNHRCQDSAGYSRGALDLPLLFIAVHWYERLRCAAFSLVDGRWRFEGMGWVAALPHQVTWLIGHLWATMPWQGKVTLLSALLCAGGECLWWRSRLRYGEQKPW